MTLPARARYSGYRFPAEIIGHAVWLYFRFPLGLRMVEELLAARGIIVSHETVRQWARKFGQQFANQIRRRLPRVGDKWHLDEVVLKIGLKQQEAPSELDHATADPSVAGFGEALFPPFRATLVRRASQAGVARHRFSVTHWPREHLMDEHIGRFNADSDDPSQESDHGV